MWIKCINKYIILCKRTNWCLTHLFLANSLAKLHITMKGAVADITNKPFLEIEVNKGGVYKKNGYVGPVLALSHGWVNNMICIFVKVEKDVILFYTLRCTAVRFNMPYWDF